jgi:hypothetical protein
MSEVFVKGQMLFLNFEPKIYGQLTRLAHAFKCKIWFRWFDRVFSETGYQVIPVLISSHSYKILSFFLEARDPKRLLTHVKAIEPSTEDLIWIEEEKLQIGAPSVETMRLHHLEAVVFHNQRVQSALPLWAQMSWSPLLEKDVLERVTYVAREHGISIYYFIVDEPTQPVKMYLKISNRSHFDRHLDKIKEILSLKDWRLVYPHNISLPKRLNGNFVGAMQLRAFWRKYMIPLQYRLYLGSLETFPRLTHDTIPAFLDAIKPHL